MSTEPVGTFHVVPPPPPRRTSWSEFAIALAIALFLNLLLLLSFILQAPRQSPPFEEPEAISVDLVQEPRPEPQPEPEPEPEQPAAQRTLTRSGGESDEPPGDPVEDESTASEAADPEPVEEPEEFTIEQQEEKPVAEEIPGWARTIEPGYDIRAGNPQTSARPQRALQSGGGGDAYLNAMGRRIVANVVYPREAAGRVGLAVFDLVVHRSGTIRHVEMVSSTGDPALDRAAADAIQRTQPFAPFPAGVVTETAALRLTLKIAPGKPPATP